jgi:hypothetical protein
MEVWFQAQIRWAVMEEGRRGLRYWREAAYIFLSCDHTTAFQQAIEMGRSCERIYREGRRIIHERLAQIVVLDRLGPNPREFLIEMPSQKATENLPFDHVFHPEAVEAPPSF